MFLFVLLVSILISIIVVLVFGFVMNSFVVVQFWFYFFQKSVIHNFSIYHEQKIKVFLRPGVRFKTQNVIGNVSHWIDINLDLKYFETFTHDETNKSGMSYFYLVSNEIWHNNMDDIFENIFYTYWVTWEIKI